MADLTRLINEQNFKDESEINAFMKGFMASGGKIPEAAPKDKTQYAQDIIYDAWDEENPIERERLAKEALKADPDCADAYLILAEKETRPSKALILLEKAVAAGERQIGAEEFKKAKGHFWGVIETRPYMRARAELADCLYSINREEEAIEHCRAMLDLNPHDNQGMRYVLLEYLGELGMFDEMEAVLRDKRYPEDSASEWLYAKVLISFRKHGECQATIEALEDALEANEHVPYALTEEDLVSCPESDIPGVEMGGLEEAYIYADNFHTAWSLVPGALEWIQKYARKIKPRILKQTSSKTGPNDKCPCGSGKKYKKCCG